MPWTDYCVCTRVCAERGSQLTEVDSDALSTPSSGILTDIQVPDAVARERTSIEILISFLIYCLSHLLECFSSKRLGVFLVLHYLPKV